MVGAPTEKGRLQILSLVLGITITVLKRMI